MKHAIWSLALFVAFAAPLSSGGTAVSFEQGFYEAYSGRQRPLPPELLDKLSRAIEFALRIGAAREISEQDLHHAHLLYYSAANTGSIAEPDGILLHTQESVMYSVMSFRRRNIFLSSDGFLQVLDCASGTFLRSLVDSEPFCTVSQVDLHMQSAGCIYFLKTDRLPGADLRRLACNIRRIRGEAVLFLLC